MNKFTLFLALFLLLHLSASAKCGDAKRMQQLEYKKAVATYVTVISQKIAKQFSANIAPYKKATLLLELQAIVNLYDPKKSSIATQKIAQNLLHALFVEGFKVLDGKSQKANCEMVATYINYKNGMLINARIVDKKTREIYTSAQVFVTRKELKSINKIYNKYSWFSQN